MRLSALYWLTYRRILFAGLVGAAVTIALLAVVFVAPLESSDDLGSPFVFAEGLRKSNVGTGPVAPVDDPTSQKPTGTNYTTLISNLGQVTAPEGWEPVGPEDGIVYVQVVQFTTGSHGDGYSISTVEAWVKDIGAGDEPEVNVYSADDDGFPNEILYTLTNPASFTDSAVNVFSAPEDAVLEADTTYYLVFENTADVSETTFYYAGFVDGNGLDPNGASGWSINTEDDYTVLFKIEGSPVASYEGASSSNSSESALKDRVYRQDPAARTSGSGARPPIGGTWSESGGTIVAFSEGGDSPPARQSGLVTSEAAKAHISKNVVEEYEGDYPWVRQAWRNRPLPVRVQERKAPGWYVYYIGGRDGFRGLARGLRFGFTVSGLSSDAIVLHELAHHFTLDTRVPNVQDAVGVGWLYFNHRVQGSCPVSEIYADVLAYVTRDKSSLKLGYLANCPQIADDAKPDPASRNVVKEVVRGNIPGWFDSHYDDGDGEIDLNAVWADIRTANQKRTITYLMRDMFGGYCSTGEANWALTHADAAGRNPWRDGGCDSRKPQNVTVIRQDGGLKVTWEPHLYEASPAVTHYVVQWRTADQDYDSSRQALIAETSDLSHTITELTNGVEHHIRVVAVNNGSTDSTVDEHGHSRAAEVTSVPGQPGKPSSLRGFPGDQAMALTWGVPEDSEVELSGYVVEWKSGSQEYDSTRRLEVPVTSPTSATITGLRNATKYKFRVTAQSSAGLDGVPAEITASPIGPPEMPVEVQAVGGRDSIRVFWDSPSRGTPPDDYLIQWRTGANYESGDNAVSSKPSAGSHVINGLAGHGRYYVRIIARNALGESEPSAEYFVMSGAPHKPADFNVEVRPGGGFDVAWDRPEPYYPNNSDFRPVRNFKTKTPIRDADGNTVPQFRYDVEYRLEGDPAGSWCSQSRFQDVPGRNNNLDPVPHRLKYLKFCEDYEPVMGESYKFRIRAAYVWKISGDTNVRNGPWAYSDALTYDPSGGPPDKPTGIEAVGGKESLLVFWDSPSSGTPPDDYLIQWRTGASYESGDNAVSSNPTAGSHLINRLAGHGRYYVRIIARNVLGESGPSAEYFVMSGAPGPLTDFDAEVRSGGGFTVTWGRPDPYYPNSKEYRPVRNFKNKKPERDADGNTVPQYRYDVEYKRADGQPEGWCSQSKYRDFGVGNDTLNSSALTVDIIEYCSGAEPVDGEAYNVRIRASYVWMKSGDTNPRNGPWVYSGPITYGPPAYNQTP